MNISVIVPIYNVERYIADCLESILSQVVSCKNYEIVVVDDGSPDNSAEIVERIAKSYSQIRLIT